MTTHDNIMSRYTTPYNTGSSSNLSKLMEVVAEPLDELYDTMDDIVAAHQLSEATGHSLDQWGIIFQCVRGSGETDDHYRARLYTQAAINKRSATVQDMVSTCASVLEVSTSRVDLVDGTSPAAFSMWVYLSDVSDAGISLADFTTMMYGAKAAGTTLTLASYGSFEHRGITGSHDATKGYNNIANSNPTGGKYAGLI